MQGGFSETLCVVAGRAKLAGRPAGAAGSGARPMSGVPFKYLILRKNIWRREWPAACRPKRRIAGGPCLAVSCVGSPCPEARRRARAAQCTRARCALTLCQPLGRRGANRPARPAPPRAARRTAPRTEPEQPPKAERTAAPAKTDPAAKSGKIGGKTGGKTSGKTARKAAKATQTDAKAGDTSKTAGSDGKPETQTAGDDPNGDATAAAPGQG